MTDRSRSDIRPGTVRRTASLKPDSGLTMEPQSAISGLEDYDLGTIHTEAKSLEKGPANKLAASRAFGESMQKDLRELCRGLEAEMAAIGFKVTSSADFQGAGEKFFHFLGDTVGIQSAATKAAAMRLRRLEAQDLSESVRQIAGHVQKTIAELAEIENTYGEDVKRYDAALKHALAKLKEAQPKFQAAKAERERLDGAVKTAKLELDSGTVSEEARPAKEAEYEDLQKQLSQVKLVEIDLLGVINNAQEHIPILQQNRNAADQGIESIHQMRRNLLEKLQNLGVLLERAMTAIRAQARLELFNNIDPAMNKTVTLVTQHNIKVATAAMEVAAQRAAQKTINPESYRKIEQELVDAVLKYAGEIADLEEESRQGFRKSSNDSGGDDDSMGAATQ